MKTVDYGVWFNKAIENWPAWVALWIIVAIVRCCVVRRTGLPFWWGILWTLPIIGWFVKTWIACTPWPNTKAPRKAKPKAKSAKKATA